MTSTDWRLVRRLLAAAVDACEAAEQLGLTDEDRGLPTGTGPVAVADVLASAWTYPENVRYAVVRARHALGADAPFQPELARALREVGALCAELVGAAAVGDATHTAPGPERDEAGAQMPSIRDRVERLATWYQGQMVVQLARAVAGRPAV